MLNPNRVGMPFSRFGVKCMIARPDPLVIFVVKKQDKILIKNKLLINYIHTF